MLSITRGSSLDIEKILSRGITVGGKIQRCQVISLFHSASPLSSRPLLLLLSIHLTFPLRLPPPPFLSSSLRGAKHAERRRHWSEESAVARIFTRPANINTTHSTNLTIHYRYNHDGENDDHDGSDDATSGINYGRQ